MQTILTAKQRINSIDLLRGIVMVIMALDHVRDFFHIHGMDGDPTNLATTSPALFFTRFITHYCAPVFVFLSGTSIFLQSQRKTKKELAIFLLTRGLWLMLIEVVVINFLFSFNPFYNGIAVQVIWVIGVSMVLMSVLIFLPFKIIFVIGLIMVLGHNFLDRYNFNSNQSIPLGWSILHQPSFKMYAPQHFIIVLYPLIPWPGVMMLGYCMGKLFTKDYDAVKRKKQLLYFGIIAIAVFAVLRYTNVYGDPALWSEQNRGTVYSIISFFNVTKYPPSLLYLCITLGPALITLTLIENIQSKFVDAVTVYGRVPMFYYLCHFFLIHLLCVIFFYASGHHNNEITDPNLTSPFLFRLQHWGYPLWVVYIIWIGVVALLYPFCKKYSEYKATHKKWWLSYL